MSAPELGHGAGTDAWENGPCDCVDCTTGPDVWCCRYCHSLSAGRVLRPEASA